MFYPIGRNEMILGVMRLHAARALIRGSMLFVERALKADIPALVGR